MSSSSDLETGPIAQQIIHKKPSKTKKKSKPPTLDHPRNEGDDPHWAYAPPASAVLLDHAVDAGPFEWDAIKDDPDTELWLIRAPNAIQPKHLQGLEIDPLCPSSSSPSQTARIGSLMRKTASYDVWSIGSDDPDPDPNADTTITSAGAEELLSLHPLLPRKRKKGRLYMAPKQVARHIVICARAPVAMSPTEGPQPLVYRNPPRVSYPKEVLTHAFVPYGARSQRARSEDVAMDGVGEAAARPSQEKPAKSKESKEKKRKVEGDTPKKSKKHKASV